MRKTYKKICILCNIHGCLLETFDIIHAQYIDNIIIMTCHFTPQQILCGRREESWRCMVYWL